MTRISGRGLRNNARSKGEQKIIIDENDEAGSLGDVHCYNNGDHLQSYQ